MPKARTSRPTPAATEGRTELEFIADRLIEKVWQGDQAKRGIATQAASVALAAIQDHTAARYMETADEFTGRDLVQHWLNRHSLIEEARASVALDKGDGETHCVDCPDEAPKLREVAKRPRRFTRDPNAVGKFLDKQRADGAEIVDRDTMLERIVDEDRELLERLGEND